MRFGKRLAEVTQNCKSGEPYVSYKELKHKLGELSRQIDQVIGGRGPSAIGEEGNSSCDDNAAKACALEEGCVGPSPLSRSRVPDTAEPLGTAVSEDSAGAVVARASTSARDCAIGGGRRFKGTADGASESFHHAFLDRLDADIEQARHHVMSRVKSLEIAVGEWQVSAVRSGALFTLEQLDELSGQFPFRVEGREVLVDWMMSLQSPSHVKAPRKALAEKYAAISVDVSELLMYIEVNMMAVRKILKKFEKKIPSEFRLLHASDYRKHHGLFMTSLQNLLLTVAQMQRLVHKLLAPEIGEEPATAALILSQIGPESIAVLSRLQGCEAISEILDMTRAARIDAYAKPSAEQGGSHGGASTVSNASVNSAPFELVNPSGSPSSGFASQLNQGSTNPSRVDTTASMGAVTNATTVEAPSRGRPQGTFGEKIGDSAASATSAVPATCSEAQVASRCARSRGRRRGGRDNGGVGGRGSGSVGGGGRGCDDRGNSGNDSWAASGVVGSQHWQQAAQMQLMGPSLAPSMFAFVASPEGTHAGLPGPFFMPMYVPSQEGAASSPAGITGCGCSGGGSNFKGGYGAGSSVGRGSGGWKGRGCGLGGNR
eukprot:TRINITY_DN5994_c0_g1_i1.p1 TRINITY_DN5994_c0_g1~~TRINITY_DN5994_c0_g1_i1.p1  ORF type:complete len:601 (-),score=126.54 TRINITY_DN5994_c0_g1_i1:207-2009(-)